MTSPKTSEALDPHFSPNKTLRTIIQEHVEARQALHREQQKEKKKGRKKKKRRSGGVGRWRGGERWQAGREENMCVCFKEKWLKFASTKKIRRAQ